MATYRVVDNDCNHLVPTKEFEEQRLQAARHTEITQYIEPDAANGNYDSLWMPPSQNEIMANGPHLIRYAGICVLLLFLSIGTVWAVTGQIYIFATLGLLGLLGGVVFIVLTKYDYQHSVAGTERQKTAELGQVLRQQLQHNHEYRMRKMELDHQFRMEKVA